MSEKYIPADVRRFVAERAGQCCEYCRTQAHYSADPFTVDHIVPRSLKGNDIKFTAAVVFLPRLL